MKLTAENYFSPEADLFYMSVSQLKNFIGCAGKRGCEARAMAMLKGEWIEETTDAMLIGSYVDAHFEGTLEQFKSENPQMYKFAATLAELKPLYLDAFKTCKTLAEFQAVFPELYANHMQLKDTFKKAEEVIARIERDEQFMLAMSGKKQVILTAKMFGTWWKCKLDSYLENRAIVDMKVMKNIRERFWIKDQGHVGFVEYWGYDMQAAIYQAIESIITGGSKLPFLIAAADKGKSTDIELIGFDDNNQHLDFVLYEIERSMPRVLKVKSGKVEPDRCGVCDYCKATKVLTEPVHFQSIIEN